MKISIEQLEKLITLKENEHCEFKEARDQFDFKKLILYCVALHWQMKVAERFFLELLINTHVKLLVLMHFLIFQKLRINF